VSQEKYTEEAKAARRALKIADHMLNITYPLVKDPKLLLGIIENLNLSLHHALGAFLQHERYFRRIPPFHPTHESMMNTFTMRLIPKYKIKADYLKLFNEVRGLLEAHRDSAIEFTKDEKLVMATEKYNLKTISTDTIRQLIKEVKIFVDDMLERVGAQ